MVKFLHKKHFHKNAHETKLVIYYSASDVFLGFLLVVLVSFFIYNYISNSLGRPSGSAAVYQTPVPNPLNPLNAPNNKAPTKK